MKQFPIIFIFSILCGCASINQDPLSLDTPDELCVTKTSSGPTVVELSDQKFWTADEIPQKISEFSCGKANITDVRLIEGTKKTFRPII